MSLLNLSWQSEKLVGLVKQTKKFKNLSKEQQFFALGDWILSFELLADELYCEITCNESNHALGCIHCDDSIEPDLRGINEYD